MEIPFWKEMVRCGWPAYTARAKFDDAGNYADAPVWCYHRYGKSITGLPDGRYIEIGGEHEDSYDPDFCIYNEVFLHDGDGNFEIYGCPAGVFPPTDFHSATLVGDHIYLIGCLGYSEQRKPGETPVYRLNIETLRMEKVETRGELPGWISRHSATYRSEANEIHVSGGKIWIKTELAEGSPAEHDYIDNRGYYILDLTNLNWRRIAT